MKKYRLHLRFPSGGVLVGGHAETPDGMHGAHARDARGRPMVPSTALRGALRETYERLLRGAGESACAGGSGRVPAAVEAARKANPEVVLKDIPCTLDRDGRCRACRLFGSRRTRIDDGERMFSALRVGNAQVVDLERETPWSIRPGVAISRRTRSAEDQRLFMRQVPSTPGLELAADVCLLDPELEHDLKVIVEITRHVGSGRSRGLGRVDLELKELPVTPAREMRIGHPGEVRLRLTLESPTALSMPIPNRSLADTRTEIPGAAVRGMVGFTLARALEDPDDEAFQHLVRESDGAHFGFLYHAGRSGGTGGKRTDAGALEVGVPLPITAQTCKLEQRLHGVRDALFERIAVKLVETPGEAEALAKVAEGGCSHRDCPGSMRAARGVRGEAGKLHIRAVTRVSIERSRQSAQEEALFSRRLIEEGATFEGSIRNVPPGSVGRLEQALSLASSIGRGHSHGWGRCRVEVLPALELTPMEKRIADFQRTFARFLEVVPLGTARVSRLIPLTLLSPLAPVSPLAPGDESGLEPILKALGVKDFLLRLRRFEREGSWDQRTGAMRAFQAVSAGGVYVIELPEGQEAGQFAETLLEFEKTGVGGFRHQGFGRIRFFDPFHLTRDMTSQQAKNDPEDKDMDTEGFLRASRGQLVEAAERVVRGLFSQGRMDLKKSQLNHLVNVCGDAASVSEIRNYLRYQAGRDGTGWNPPMAEQVIDGPAKALGEIETRNEQLEADVRQRLQVDAWKLYAIYLTRAFTYEDKVRRDRNQGPRGAGPGRG